MLQDCDIIRRYGRSRLIGGGGLCHQIGIDLRPGHSFGVGKLFLQAENRMENDLFQ